MVCCPVWQYNISCIAVNYGGERESEIFYCWVSVCVVKSENWSAIPQSRSRLLFVLAHNYDNSSCTSQASLPDWTIICQYFGPPDWVFQFYKLIIKKLGIFDYLLHLFHSFKKLWQASQHEASLPPNFSTFLWQILSRSRPQILKYFKQKPQLNSTRLKYFILTFILDPDMYYVLLS